MRTKDFQACVFKVLHNSQVVGVAFVVDTEKCFALALLPPILSFDQVRFKGYNSDDKEFNITINCRVEEVDRKTNIHLLHFEYSNRSIKFLQVTLLDAGYCLNHTCTTFGFESGHFAKIGQQGHAKVTSNTGRDPQGFPILQLKESQNITRGFLGSPLYDTQDKGIIGIIYAGKDQSSIGGAIQVDYVVKQFPKYLRHLLQQPPQRLPLGFEYLNLANKQAQYTHIPPQSFLQQAQLPYLSRNGFKRHQQINQAFVTESKILDTILNVESSILGGLIMSNSGIGKTRLLLETGKLAQQQNWVIIYVHSGVTELWQLKRHLLPDTFYLILVDDLEQHQFFNFNFRKTVQQLEASTATVRFLATCHFNHKKSSRFPKNERDFICFYLADRNKNSPERQYQKAVMQHVIGQFNQRSTHLSFNFFEHKSSFAIFFHALSQKRASNQQIVLATNHKFKSWLFQQLAYTLDKKDISHIDEKIFHFLFLLPLDHAALKVIEQDKFYQNIITKLINAGWLQYNQGIQGLSLQMTHQSIKDALLLSQLEWQPKHKTTFTKALTRFFNTSIQFNLPLNWLRTMERIYNFSPLSKYQDLVFSIIQQQLEKLPNPLYHLPILLLQNPSLKIYQKCKLLISYPNFFKSYSSTPSLGYELACLLNKEKKNPIDAKLKTQLQKFLKTWLSNNPNFLENPDLAAKVLSHYINAFNIDSSIEPLAYQYLCDYPLYWHSHFVFQAWFRNKKEIDYLIKRNFLKFLQRYPQVDKIGYALEAFLKHTDNFEDIKPYCLATLNQHSNRPYVGQIFKHWLTHANSLKAIIPALKIFLKAQINHPKDNTKGSEVLVAFIKHPESNTTMLTPIVSEFLTQKIDRINHVSILTAWLQKTKAPKALTKAVTNYLKHPKLKAEAGELMLAWLQEKGDWQLVVAPYLKYISQVPPKDLNPELLLEAAKNGLFESDLKYWEQYIEHYPSTAETANLLFYWLNQILKKKTQDRDPEVVKRIQPLVRHFFETNSTSDKKDKLLIFWLRLGAPIDKIWPHYKQSLEEQKNNFTPYKALINTWITQNYTLTNIQPYVIHAFNQHITSPLVAVIVRLWIEKGGELHLATTLITKYLNKHLNKDTEQPPKQLPKLFDSWLKYGGNLELIEQPLHTLFNFLYTSYKNEEKIPDTVSNLLLSWLQQTKQPKNLLSHLENHVISNANFKLKLFEIWFDRAGNLNNIQDIFKIYLYYSTIDKKHFDLAYKWLKLGGDLTTVEDFLRTWIEHFPNDKKRIALLKEILDGGGFWDFS